VGHEVHSGAFGAQNVDALFFMIRSWCGFHKNRARTCYSKLMFFLPLESVGHVVHYDASGS
jgi:hypothetical protein